MPRILFWDIETSYNILKAFQLLNRNMLPHTGIVQERNILTAAWKWGGQKKATSVSIKSTNPADDKHIVKTLLDLFETADAVVAHYGDKFDMRFFKSRCIYHGFKPPAPVRQIDTYKIAKNIFLFNSNRLDYLGLYLGLGRKMHTDYSLWDGCMSGDEKSIKKMQRYNEQDVELLESVYNRLAPYSNTRINAAIGRQACPHCGGTKLQSRGFNITATGMFRRFQCRNKDCGKWSSSTKATARADLR